MIMQQAHPLASLESILSVDFLFGSRSFHIARSGVELITILGQRSPRLLLLVAALDSIFGGIFGQRLHLINETRELQFKTVSNAYLWSCSPFVNRSRRVIHHIWADFAFREGERLAIKERKKTRAPIINLRFIPRKEMQWNERPGYHVIN